MSYKQNFVAILGRKRRIFTPPNREDVADAVARFMANGGSIKKMLADRKCSPSKYEVYAIDLGCLPSECPIDLVHEDDDELTDGG